MKHQAKLTIFLCAALLALQATRASAADLKRGELLFQTCTACHSVLGNGMGPDILGILGQPSAQRAGFKYSPAMLAANLTWDEATLRAFVKDPQAVVKGTTMVFAGYVNPADLDSVLAYLKIYKE